MPILETLNPDSYKSEDFIDADILLVGEAYARLLGFTEGDALVDTFKCDAGTWNALRRATCRILDMSRDKSTDVEWHRKPGTKKWNRVNKDTRVPSNHERKTTVVRSYSTDAVRKGIATLREQGIALRRNATRIKSDNGTLYVVALVRNGEADADAS